MRGTAELARKFKISLSEDNLVLRRPSDYAEKLHITTGYLNDVIKKTTGSSVTYWIHQEVSIRSKHALYHTDLDIKEIAYQLGFRDHVYFIRLFRKLNGVSPLKFRLLKRRNN
ncbi:helix-turn-helix domain-containing protein [Mucilaginibacter pocheonensis]|uniref:helix-turn-helix domain-containing protein n=1 Tax=Mucilaginibacter pocheonensis TaxID=398050 RepID=UPI0035B51B97